MQICDKKPLEFSHRVKVIGQVQVKKFMLGLYEGDPCGGTEVFYKMSKLICIQKLLHFEVGDLLGSLIKK